MPNATDTAPASAALDSQTPPFPIYRPKLLPREDLIWQRDPMATAKPWPVTKERRFIFGVSAAVFVILALVGFSRDHPLAWLALLPALLLAYEAFSPRRHTLPGGLIAQTLTNQRLILAPWKSVRLKYIEGVRTRGAFVLVKVAGHHHQIGPLPAPDAVAAKIEAARPNA